MEISVINNPIMTGIAGLTVGLFIAFIVIIRAWFSRRALIDENAKLLRGHVLMHDTGHKTLIAELEALRRQSENLRVTVATLKNKTDKSEIRTLHIYDQAIRLMNARAPGFGPVWESSLSEAEFSMQQIDSGVVAWVRRTIRPSLGNKPTQTSVSSATHSPAVNVDHNSGEQKVNRLWSK